MPRTRYWIAPLIVLVIIGLLCSHSFAIRLSHASDVELLIPIHVKMLTGRQLFVGEDGSAYVRIDPAAPVRLSTELLPVTFSTVQSGEEALELVELLHTGAIVESEKMFNDITNLFESYGLKRDQGRMDNSSFTVKKGTMFGEKIEQGSDSLHVTFVALVSNLKRMGQGLRISRFDYYFMKNGDLIHSEENILLSGLALDWQTMEGSPPERVPQGVREEIARKAIKLCGKALPPGRKTMRVGRVAY